MFRFTIDTYKDRTVAAMWFADFDQSMRFMGVLTKFILAERGPPQILEDIAWYCPPSIQNGKI